MGGIESHGEGGQCEDSACTGDEAERAQLPCMVRQRGIRMRGSCGDAAFPGDAVMLQQTRGLAGGIAFEEHLGGKALCIVPALVVVPELASVVKFQPRTFHAHAVSRVIVTAPSLPQVCEVA